MRLIHGLEPLWWALFGLGGTVAALLVPVHVFLNNIAAPLGWVSLETDTYAGAAALLGHPVVKAYLALLLVTTFYHAAHRLSFVPHEFTLSVFRPVVGAIAYSLATALSVATVVIVVLAP